MARQPTASPPRGVAAGRLAGKQYPEIEQAKLVGKVVVVLVVAWR